MTDKATLKIGAIVLAAGFSRRFGSLKLAAKFTPDTTVLEQTLSTIRSVIPNIIVISRADISSTLKVTTDEIIHFEEAELGMGASLAFGISRVTDWDAAIICLGDMPTINPDSYLKLAAQAHPDIIVVPNHGGKKANPVVFGSAFFGELRKLKGDSGGRQVIEQHPEAVKVLDLLDIGLLQDIDTPSDLAKLQQQKPDSH